jgi:hypothetical protein
MRVDEAKKTLEWRGVQYSIINTLRNSVNAADDICAKYCWTVKKNDVSFTVGTATQGAAYFTDPVTNQDVECEIPKAVYCKGQGAYGRCAR